MAATGALASPGQPGEAFVSWGFPSERRSGPAGSHYPSISPDAQEPFPCRGEGQAAQTLHPACPKGLG